MKASIKNYKQSPRKVRLVGNLIKGKSVAVAETELHMLPKRAALPILKLLQSAVANAILHGNAEKDALVISSVRVDKGLVMKRWMPRAFGRASRINKRTSHVVIELTQREEKIKKSKNITKSSKLSSGKKPVAKS
jgi:large subunit ribosomal protein L22